jgi:hypothetical protein
VADFAPVGPDQLSQWLALGALVLLGLLVLWVLDSRRIVAAYLVGGTGVLMDVQVGRVHAFTIATLLWLACTKPVGGRRWIPALTLGTAAGLLSVTVLFGDLVNSRTLALQLMAFSITAGSLYLRSDAEDARAMLRGAFYTITAGAVVGLLQVAGVIQIELWHTQVSSIGRPVGIWPEPDWMGLMGALGLLLAWRLPLSQLMRTVALSVNGLAFVLAFARAAWVALAVTVIVVVVTQLIASRRAERARGRGSAVLVLLLVAVVLLVANPDLRSDLGRRLDTLTAGAEDDVSGQARVLQTRALLFLADSAFPFGHGLSASGRVGVTGDLFLQVSSVNNVASNWLLGMWVDGALLALPLIVFLAYVALRELHRLEGQLLLVVLLNSLWSNAVFMPVTWLCLGLAMHQLATRSAAATGDVGPTVTGAGRFLGRGVRLRRLEAPDPA